MSSKSTFSNSTSKSYALALYELAKENSELNKVEDGIKGLKTLLSESSDFKQGDLFEMQDNTGIVRRFTVDFITSDTSLTCIEEYPGTTESSTILRKRSMIEEQEELVMISKLPKGAVKTLKAETLNNNIDTTLTIRRHQTIQLAGGVGSITLPEGESFVSFNEDDYMITVVAPHSGSSVANQVFSAGHMFKPNESAAWKKKFNPRGS